MKPAMRNQGTAVVEKDGRSFLLMTPDGQVTRHSSAKQVEAAARAWAKGDADADKVNALVIEWRGCKPCARSN